MTVKELKTALSQFDEDEEIFVMGTDEGGYDASEAADLIYFYRRQNDKKIVLSAVERVLGRHMEQEVRKWAEHKDAVPSFVGKGGTLYV